MHSEVGLCVVGPEQRTTALVRALLDVGLHSRCLTGAQAHRGVGSLLGAQLIVWASPPGSTPDPEAEGYASGAVGLYCHWGSNAAVVGPVVAKGAGPCPRCLRSPDTDSTVGDNPLLGAWAVAMAALQCEALLRVGSSELVGASWSWRLDAPGLTLLARRRRVGCLVRGCSQA